MNTNTEPKKISVDSVVNTFSKWGGKLGQQRHLAAMRDAFATFLPFMIAAAFAVMIKNVFIDPNGLIGGQLDQANNGSWMAMNDAIGPVFDGIAGATLDLFSIYSSFLIGYFLSRSYGENGLFGGLIALAAFFLLRPLQASETFIADNDFWNPNYLFLGARGLMPAIAVSLLSVTAYTQMTKWEWMKVSMPKGVPPAVAKSFNVLFPVSLTLLAFGLIQPMWQLIATHTLAKDHVGGPGASSWFYLFGTIEKAIGQPFLHASSNFGFVFGLAVMMGLLFFFGLHGPMIMAPILAVTWDVSQTENMNMYSDFYGRIHSDGIAIGERLFDDSWMLTHYGVQLHDWSRGAFDFTGIGGTGATLGLVITTLAISKRNTAAFKISTVALAPSIFNINEPVIFGLPVMLNFNYFIPFVFGQAILSIAPFLMIKGEIVNNPVLQVPWTAPYFLMGYIGTLDPMSFLLSGFNFFLSIGIWIPFVLLDYASTKKNNPDAIEMDRTTGFIEDSWILMKRIPEIWDKDRRPEKTIKNEDEKVKRDASKANEEAINLEKMTVSQLKATASLKGVEIPPEAQKSEIIELLKKAFKFNEESKIIEISKKETNEKNSLKVNSKTVKTEKEPVKPVSKIVKTEKEPVKPVSKIVKTEKEPVKPVSKIVKTEKELVKPVSKIVKTEKEPVKPVSKIVKTEKELVKPVSKIVKTEKKLTKDNNKNIIEKPVVQKLSREELNKRTTEDLKHEAKKLNATGYSKANKAELVEIVFQALVKRSSRAQLNKWTIDDLKHEAKKLNATGYSKADKSELVEIVFKALRK